MGKYPICHHITEGCIIPCIFSILILYLHFYLSSFIWIHGIKGRKLWEGRQRVPSLGIVVTTRSSKLIIEAKLNLRILVLTKTTVTKSVVSAQVRK